MRKLGYYRVLFRGFWEIAYFIPYHNCWKVWKCEDALLDHQFDEINEDPIDPDPASEYQHDFKPA